MGADKMSRFLVAVSPNRSMDTVSEGMANSKHGSRAPGSNWYELGLCVLMSSPCDISSTAVRNALLMGDVEAASKMVAPSVLSWLIENAPYAALKIRREGNHVVMAGATNHL